MTPHGIGQPLATDAANAPMTAEPDTLTSRVPQGNPGPASRVTASVIPWRRTPPIPLPTAIASHIAHVLTGGDVDPGTLVTEDYLMTLERQAFCDLVAHPKTQERILGLLSTGKPLRN